MAATQNVKNGDSADLAALTVTSLSINGVASSVSISTDAIAETTAANGVAVDGLTIKDGGLGAVQAITGDGAITIANYATVFLSKGSAAAITLAAPTAGTQDRFEITIIAASAQAHVVTCSTVGFNAKGSSGTLTFTAAIGNSVVLVAYNGNWYTKAVRNVTAA